MQPDIRLELPTDWQAIHEVNARAFPTSAEADLIDRLREQDEIYVSMVALHDGQVVGHVLYTRLRVERCGEDLVALGLGPVAVRPEYQGKLIGTHLIRASLDEVAERGAALVFLLGHPGFYGRFGFENAAPLGYSCEFPAPEGCFQVLDLRPGAVRTAGGLVRYPSAFSELE